MRAALASFAVCLLVLASSTAARADSVDIPVTLTHQGRLLDATDQPVSGTLQLTFKLYRQDSGGTALWTDTRTVDFDAGAYAVVLGDPSAQPANPLTSDVFDGPVFLGVQVADGNELSPRLRVSSVPFAVRADLANRIDGGTITNATITNSDVDAAELKVNGTPVIDGSGHFVGPTDGLSVTNAQQLGGVAASGYLTRTDAQAGYVSGDEFATTNFSNLVVNGSFELGSAGALPQGWSARGVDSGVRAITTTDGAVHGQAALRIDDGDNQGTHAVEQLVIENGDGAAVRGRSFTAAVAAKRLVGTTSGRLCLVDADGDDPAATSCADLTTSSDFTRTTVTHTMSAGATYLRLILDTGHSDADANDYVFDDAMVVEGTVAPDYAPNVTEQLYDEGIPASKLAGDIPSTMITGPIPSSQITGSIPSSQISGSIPSSQITGSIPSSQIAGSIPSSQISGQLTASQIADGAGSGLDADSLDGLDSAKFMRADANTSTTGTLDVTGQTSIGGGAIIAGSTNEIWTQPQADNDDATLYVNYRGYADGQTRFRNFVVADGKGNTVLAVDGSNSTTTLSGPLNVGGIVTATQLDVSGTTVTTAFGSTMGSLTLSGSGVSLGTTLTIAKKYDQNHSDLQCWYRFTLDRPTAGGWHQAIIEDSTAGGGVVTHVQDGLGHWYSAFAMAKLTNVPAGSRTINFENQDTQAQGDEIYDREAMCFEVVR